MGFLFGWYTIRKLCFPNIFPNSNYSISLKRSKDWSRETNLIPKKIEIQNKHLLNFSLSVCIINWKKIGGLKKLFTIATCYVLLLALSKWKITFQRKAIKVNHFVPRHRGVCNFYLNMILRFNLLLFFLVCVCQPPVRNILVSCLSLSHWRNMNYGLLSWCFQHILFFRQYPRIRDL